MLTVKLLCVGGMLLLFGAVAPAFAQVTILNDDDDRNPPNPPPGATAVQDPNGLTVRPTTEANALIVVGPINNDETVPSIDLDKLLREQSGKPTTNNVAEYMNPPGRGSWQPGGAVGGLLDRFWQSEDR
jgi:hypothetical protein